MAIEDVPAGTGSRERPLVAPNAGRVLLLLFLANLFNFFDRVIPSIVAEPIRAEFGLSDTQLGVLLSAFVVVYAIAGLPLGRLADRASRKKIMGWGLAGWSLLTAATGMATNFATLLLIRLGVGVGEASYAPAANALIADLYPASRRARATGVFMLGLPLGLVLAFFTIGRITEAFGTWRAPFLLAAVPGLGLAVLMFLITEPARGAAESAATSTESIDRPLRRIASIRTMWWLTAAFCFYNVAAYAVNGFSVPLIQRYFGQPLTTAAVLTGVIVGVTGLVGLTLGGQLADRADRRSARHRVLLGAGCVGAAAPLTFGGLLMGPAAVVGFVVLMSLGWLLGYLFFTAAYPAVADVIEPRLRATAMALMFLVGYLLGGAGGPVLTGALSDAFAHRAMAAAGAGELTAAHQAIGLHDAMLWVVPIGLAAAAGAMFLAAGTVAADRARMRAGTTGSSSPPRP